MSAPRREKARGRVSRETSRHSAAALPAEACGRRRGGLSGAGPRGCSPRRAVFRRLLPANHRATALAVSLGRVRRRFLARSPRKAPRGMAAKRCKRALFATRRARRLPGTRQRAHGGARRPEGRTATQQSAPRNTPGPQARRSAVHKTMQRPRGRGKEQTLELRFSPLFSGSSGNSLYAGCDGGPPAGGRGRLLRARGGRIAQDRRRSGAALRRARHPRTHRSHTRRGRALAQVRPARVRHGGHLGGDGGQVGRRSAEERARARTIAGLLPRRHERHDLRHPPRRRPTRGATRSRWAGRASPWRRISAACARAGWAWSSGSDAVVLESNYDPDMLRAGPYPYALKQRILGRRGHLANDDAGRAAVELVRGGARQIVLGHLSKENNFPRWRRRVAPWRWRAMACAWARTHPSAWPSGTASPACFPCRCASDVRAARVCFT